MDAIRQVQWDGKTLGPWRETLENADVVVNLAGRSVNCRYNEKNKAEIYASRLDSTRILGEAIRDTASQPKLWLNSSTATIYRHAEDRPMDEATGELGTGFSCDVAQKWEKTFFDADTPRVRKVALRSAIVMGKDAGSAFGHYRIVVKAGLGGAEGNGRQMVSWIHIKDWLRAVDWIIDHPELAGIVNVSSPEPLANHEFMAVTRHAFGVPVGLPLPAWMLAIGAVFLRTETELILKSRCRRGCWRVGSSFSFRIGKARRGIWRSRTCTEVHATRSPQLAKSQLQ
jgi:hypothetical protein